MKKYCLVFCFIVINLLTTPIFAQETDIQATDDAAEIQEMPQEEVPQDIVPFQIIPTRFAKPGSFLGFLKQWHVMLALSPTFVPNNAPLEVSMPLAIVVPVTVGLFWQNNFFVSVEPNISFFMNYYLWDENTKTAYYAEAENRTALAVDLMIDMPLVFTINVSRKSSLKLSASVTGLLRFGFLAIGIEENEKGSSGTVKRDVEKINEWFWKDANFMHFGFGAAWMFKVGSNENPVEIGPEVKIRLPANQKTGNPFMLSVGLKVIL